jgi:hypothetical protein
MDDVNMHDIFGFSAIISTIFDTALEEQPFMMVRRNTTEDDIMHPTLNQSIPSQTTGASL